ncbi:DUF2809 domain-containing protein [Paenibacillus lactis]|uniref:DUF2809 domain-containing protein n=3 Tax=Paenibacillus lactis TaxID=228574 RepID=G4H9E2_9BACL|nr:hypothetical protein PaelaDRAFT_0603 [Paenibacillus lactis 154]MBP1893495.1 membrane-bound ClpP family serine protease [Paenibacillus lactis]
MSRRLVYFSLSLMCIIFCILIVLLFSEMPFIRGLVGDVIIVVFIYYFIMTLKDFNSIYVVIFTLVLAFITEVLQYFHFASILGLQHNKIAQLIIGSIFDPMDMIAYTIGGIVAFIIDTKIIKKPKNTHIRTY